VAEPSPAAVYLDHAATTPVRAEVAEAMARAETDAWANPSSPHAAGRRAKRLLEDCRETILGLLGARVGGPGRDRLVFTSGATEANRLAVLGLAGRGAGTFASSARDHASIRTTRTELAGRGWRIVEMPLAAAGCVDPGWRLPPRAEDRPLIATTLVCGQSGAVEDVRRLVATHPDALVHVDATQAIVCEPVSFAGLGVASLAVAPHKFEGPRGIGALVVRGDVGIEPRVPGPQEAGLRGGTEAVALAAGFARALELAVAERLATVARLAALRERFSGGFAAAAAAHGLAIEAILPAGGSPHLLALAIRGGDRQAFVMAADLAGVACATGTACSSGSSEPSPAIAALGLPADVVAGTVRFSFGRTTTQADVDEAVRRLAPVLARLRRFGVDSRST
jgi:cysteine desulfurase